MPESLNYTVEGTKMKNFGIALIVVGIVLALLGLFGVQGGGIIPLPVVGLVAIVGGYLLYRRHRPSAGH